MNENNSDNPQKGEAAVQGTAKLKKKTSGESDVPSTPKLKKKTSGGSDVPSTPRSKKKPASLADGDAAPSTPRSKKKPASLADGDAVPSTPRSKKKPASLAEGDAAPSTPRSKKKSSTLAEADASDTAGPARPKKKPSSLAEGEALPATPRSKKKPQSLAEGEAPPATPRSKKKPSALGDENVPSTPRTRARQSQSLNSGPGSIAPRNASDVSHATSTRRISDVVNTRLPDRGGNTPRGGPRRMSLRTEQKGRQVPREQHVFPNEQDAKEDPITSLISCKRDYYDEDKRKGIKAQLGFGKKDTNITCISVFQNAIMTEMIDANNFMVEVIPTMLPRDIFAVMERRKLALLKQNRDTVEETKAKLSEFGYRMLDNGIVVRLLRMRLRHVTTPKELHDRAKSCISQFINTPVDCYLSCIDKHGRAIAEIVPCHTRQELALVLLENGMAKLRSENPPPPLFTAQERARIGRLGIWAS